jgi:hypothetical protein
LSKRRAEADSEARVGSGGTPATGPLLEGPVISYHLCGFGTLCICGKGQPVITHSNIRVTERAPVKTISPSIATSDIKFFFPFRDLHHISTDEGECRDLMPDQWRKLSGPLDQGKEHLMRQKAGEGAGRGLIGRTVTLHNVG